MADLAIVGSISPYILTQSRNIFHCWNTRSINYLALFKFSYPFRYFSCFL